MPTKTFDQFRQDNVVTTVPVSLPYGVEKYYKDPQGRLSLYVGDEDGDAQLAVSIANPYNFVVQRQGSNYVAKNSRGDIAFVGSDFSTVMQSCIDAIPVFAGQPNQFSDSGGSIMLSGDESLDNENYWVVNSTIVVNKRIVISSNGNPKRNPVLQLASGADFDMFHIDTTNIVRLEKMRLIGNRVNTDTPCSCIVVLDGNEFSIMDLEIRDFSGYGIDVRTTGSQEYNHICDNYILECELGMIRFNANTVDGCIISRNYIGGSERLPGIIFQPSGTNNGFSIIISQNRFLNCWISFEQGPSGAGLSGVVISNNAFRLNGSSAITAYIHFKQQLSARTQVVLVSDNLFTGGLSNGLVQFIKIEPNNNNIFISDNYAGTTSPFVVQDDPNASNVLVSHRGNHNFAQSAPSFATGTDDGSWRMIESGNDLVFQKLESGVWVTKSTITP